MRLVLKTSALLILFGIILNIPFAIADNLSTSVRINVVVPPPPPPPPPPPGGGGGGGGFFIPVVTQVTFKGKAYPSSRVTLLKDNQIATQVPASPDASFEISLSGLSAGTYNFSLYAEDNSFNRSATQNFTITVTSGVTTIVNGIFLPPTISLDKEQVKRGDILNILGQTVPQATVSVFIGSDEEIIKKTAADKTGIWLYKFDTSEVAYGDHSAKARASKDNDYTSFSSAVAFTVGSKTVYATQKPKCPSKGDLNNDCRVNLVDFSMAAYWWKRPLTEAAKNNIDAKLKPDGKIDLSDFSIMAYYWTG